MLAWKQKEGYEPRKDTERDRVGYEDAEVPHSAEPAMLMRDSASALKNVYTNLKRQSQGATDRGAVRQKIIPPRNFTGCSVKIPLGSDLTLTWHREKPSFPVISVVRHADRASGLEESRSAAAHSSQKSSSGCNPSARPPRPLRPTEHCPERGSAPSSPVTKETGVGGVRREMGVGRTHLLPPLNTMGYSQVRCLQNAEEVRGSRKGQDLLVSWRRRDGP